MRCAIITPRQEDMLGERGDHYLAECILSRGHQGPHIIKTPEDKYIAWEDDWDCGCCADDEDDRCYTHWPLSQTEIRDLV